MDNQNHDEVVSQFCAMTSTRPSEAQEYLAANGWEIEAAVTEFFAEQDEAMQDPSPDAGQARGDQEGQPAGRTLGGESAPSSGTGTPQQSSRNQGPRRGVATLGDFASGAGHSDDDDGDDDEVDQDFYAGGGKSGLAVQNPDDLKKKIIEKAKNTQLPGTSEPAPKKSHFTGSARTLGGDEEPSRVIDAPSAPTGPAAQPPQRVHRILHFWADGFSVDEGDLYRTDDPRNAEILEGIRQGRAPLSIMNVQPGQEVDVELKQHDEKFVRPKPKYKPFSGPGQRLGSPTPSVRQEAPTTTAAPEQADPEAAKPNVDESQPVVTLQVRLGDGTRLTSRFNASHTIGDVYQFVAAASPISQTRPWALMTTFPSKELTDKAAVLGDLAEFKRGGVVVQKWQ